VVIEASAAFKISSDSSGSSNRPGQHDRSDDGGIGRKGFFANFFSGFAWYQSAQPIHDVLDSFGDFMPC